MFLGLLPFSYWLWKPSNGGQKGGRGRWPSLLPEEALWKLCSFQRVEKEWNVQLDAVRKLLLGLAVLWRGREAAKIRFSIPPFPANGALERSIWSENEANCPPSLFFTMSEPFGLHQRRTGLRRSKRSNRQPAAHIAVVRIYTKQEEKDESLSFENTFYI